MSKNRTRTEDEAKAEALAESETQVDASEEQARRKAHIEAYKKANPVKATTKKLLSKDGKTLISLEDWVKEA